MARPIVKLLHGPDTINLQGAAASGTGRYKVAPNFAPPTVFRSVTYGADQRGSTPVVKEMENVDFSFSVHIKAGSPQELERGKRELQSFLNRAGGRVPLYLAYRSYDNYDYEPYFGMQGAYARYEIVHGALGAHSPVTQFTANTFLSVPVNLIIKPQAVYPPQPSGQATGGIFEDYIGKPDGRSRGTLIAEATTNKFTNPAFMHGTWNTGWTASVVLVAENKDAEYVLFGDTSARIQNPTPGAATHFTQSINVGNTNTHTISYYIKREDSGAITSAEARIWYGGTITPDAVVSVGDGWYRVYADVTGVASATATGVLLVSNLTFYVDGFQIEEKSSPTPFCYGDFLDCTWAGTKHESTSTRTVTRLRYAYGDILGRLTNYTIRVVWMPFLTAMTGNYLCEDSDDDLALFVDTSERYNFATSSGASILSSAVTFTAGTTEIIHATFDGDTATIYRNGASIATGTIAENTALPTWLYIGSRDEVAGHINQTIQGFATFQRAMSAAEVLADYNAVRYQAEDGERIDPLPWVFTEDGDNIVDNDNDGTLNNYCVVGGLMGDDVDTAYKLDSSNSFVLGPGVTWGSLPVDQRQFDKDILTTGGTNTLLFINGDDGTVDADANANRVDRIGLSTSESSSMATAITPLGARLLREGKSVAGFFVAKDAAPNTNVQVKFQITVGDNSETYYETEWRTLATSEAFRPYITAPLSLDFALPLLDSQRKLGFRFRFRRTAGASTQNFDISHAIYLVDYSTVYTGDVGATVAVDMAYARGIVWEGVDDAVPTLTIGRRTFNRPLRIRPEYLNVLMLQHTSDNYAASKTTWTSGYNLEIEQFVVTPRFDIF